MSNDEIRGMGWVFFWAIGLVVVIVVSILGAKFRAMMKRRAERLPRDPHMAQPGRLRGASLNFPEDKPPPVKR